MDPLQPLKGSFVFEIHHKIPGIKRGLAEMKALPISIECVCITIRHKAREKFKEFRHKTERVLSYLVGNWRVKMFVPSLDTPRARAYWNCSLSGVK